MYDDTDLTAIVTALVFVFGFAFGLFLERQFYLKDTHDCTTKCEDIEHSIKYNDVCYCEVK